MKIKNIVTVLLIAFILASCTPAAKVVPTETAVPTSTFTPVPTATVTSTPIPTINVEGQNIPDPRFSNPDFFDVSNAESPIVQFANDFGFAPEEVLNRLHVEMEIPEILPAFAVLRTSDGYALFMAQQDENGNWVWENANPGPYWHAQGKWIGTSLGGAQTKDFKISSIISNYFEGGILGLKGQIRPGPDISERKPSNARYEFELAKKLGMAIYFHYLAEPGKFLSNVNKTNVDEWLNTSSRSKFKLKMAQNLLSKG